MNKNIFLFSRKHGANEVKFITPALLILLVSIFLLSLTSISAGLTSTIDTPKISSEGLTIELKDVTNVQWIKEDNSYTPEYKDVRMYNTITDSKTGVVTKALKPLTNVTFRVNKLEEINCLGNSFYQECSGYRWDFSKFESKNTITNKEIKAVYQEKDKIWIIELWEDFMRLFGKEFPNAELIGYDITYYGTIVDLDPVLDLVFTTSQYGFFNQTNATANGVRLQYNNLTGDYKSLVWYNQSQTFWNITLSIADTQTTRTGIVNNKNEINLSDSGLVSYWALDGNFDDGTGRNNGTCDNCPNNASGLSSNAMSFNGIDDYFNTTATASATVKGTLGFYDNETFTLSVWYKGTDTATNAQTKAFLGWDSGSLYGAFGLTGGKPTFMHYNGTAYASNIQHPVSIADNNWHHVLYTNYENSTGTLYVDGVSSTSGVSTMLSGANRRYFQPVTIMRNYNVKYTNGTIDEVLIYNTSLTASQVQQLYKSGLSQHANTNVTIQTRTANSYNVSDVGLVALWGLNSLENITLGSELLVNGNMEANANWTTNVNTPTTNAQSSEQKHGGTYSWKIVADSQWDGTSSDYGGVSVTAGRRYKLSGWLYVTQGSATLSLRNWTTDASLCDTPTVSATSTWTYVECNGTAQTNTANVFVLSSSAGAGTFYFDDVSVKEWLPTAVDELGRNNGTCSGTGCPTLTANGTVGNAMLFDGVNDWVNITQPIQPKLVTLSLWIRTTSTSATYRSMASCYNFDQKKGFGLMLSSTHQPYFQVGNGTAINSAVSGTSINNGNWYHLVGTYNGSNIDFYENGVLKQSTTNVKNNIAYYTHALEIGRHPDGSQYYWNGTIDEVRIYNRSLSASEVLDLYNLGSYHLNWNNNGAWSSESLVNDNIATLVNTNSTFMQFKTNLYTNTTGISPYIINYSILQHTSGGSVPPSDTIYPIFSSYWDNNATLIDSGLGLFNVTVEDTNGTVWLEVTTNHTAVNLTSNIYNASKSFIASGVYFYRWYAYGNGTNKNLNYSALRSYTVNSSGDTTPPYFITIPANATITYGESLGVQFVGTDAVSFGTYYLGNWTNRFSINSTGWLSNITSLSAGTYQINVTINDSVGNTNMTWYKLIINKATSQTGLTFDKATPQEYGTAITPTCSLITGVGSVSLTNGTSGVPETLGAGVWNINCSYAGNTNYSSSSNLTLYTITKNSSLILGISGTTPITYGTITDVAGSSCPAQLSCSLSPSNAIFSAGVKTFNYSTSGNDNYTASSITKDITINKVSPSLSIGANPSWNENNNTEVTITGSGCPAQLTCELYKDNGLESNPFVSYFTEGSYSFVYNTTGNTNYTIGSDSNTLVITNYTTPPPAGNVTTTSVARCRYKKLGYYNLKLPWLRQENCI